jgi:hypothetical protein
MPCLSLSLVDEDGFDGGKKSEEEKEEEEKKQLRSESDFFLSPETPFITTYSKYAR